MIQGRLHFKSRTYGSHEYSPILARRVLFVIVYYTKIVNYWERTKVHHAQILLILLPSLLFHKVFLLSLVEERFEYYLILLYRLRIPICASPMC